MNATPAYRDRLAVPTYGTRRSPYGNGPSGFAGNVNIGAPPPSVVRQPLGDMDPNIMPPSGMNGHGMSAGVKVGRQQAGGTQYRGTPAAGRNLGHSILGLR